MNRRVNSLGVSINHSASSCLWSEEAVDCRSVQGLGTLLDFVPHMSIASVIEAHRGLTGRRRFVHNRRVRAVEEEGEFVLAALRTCDLDVSSSIVADDESVYRAGACEPIACNFARTATTSQELIASISWYLENLAPEHVNRGSRSIGE